MTVPTDLDRAAAVVRRHFPGTRPQDGVTEADLDRAARHLGGWLPLVLAVKRRLGFVPRSLGELARDELRRVVPDLGR